MPRYWVIAPVESKPPELFDKVWQFDLANNVISIGWSELGDVSKMSREELQRAVAATYPDKPPQTHGLYANMIWAFYHEVAIGDFVIARRGRKMLVAVGKVLNAAVYTPGRNPHLASEVYPHFNFLDVEWLPQPRDKSFPTVVFPMPTVSEFTEQQFHSALEGSGVLSPVEIPEPVFDQYTFGLEKYLEDFIVGNFSTIFKDELKIYEDEDGNEGQQYYTEIGLIDILAVESKTKSFVVIELKKGRTSDQVVGQILRYMGWVKKNIATNGQTVKGLVICQKPDDKLTYALSVTPNVNVRYYSVSFKLSEPS